MQQIDFVDSVMVIVTGASPTQAVRSYVVFVVHLSCKWIQAKKTVELCGLWNMGRSNSGHVEGNRKQDWYWEHRLQVSCMSSLYKAGLAASAVVVRHQSICMFHLRNYSTNCDEIWKFLTRKVWTKCCQINFDRFPKRLWPLQTYITRSCNTGHYKMANTIFIGLWHAIFIF
jgi:hypothetical protein